MATTQPITPNKVYRGAQESEDAKQIAERPYEPYPQEKANYEITSKDLSS